MTRGIAAFMNVRVSLSVLSYLPYSSDSEASRADTRDSPPQPGTETLTLSRPLSTQQCPPQSASVPNQTVMLRSWGV